MRELLKKMKEIQVVFSRKDIEKIIVDFESEFEKNIVRILEAINKDYKQYNLKISTEELREYIKNIKEQPIYVTEAVEGNCIVDGIGTIITVCNGKPNIIISMLLNTIKTHNKMVLCVKNKFETSELIVEIMKKVLKDNNQSDLLVNIIEDYVSIESCQEYIDKVIFVGSKYDYINLRKKLYVDTEYNGYGYISLFYDNDECIHSLQNMKMYALNNLIELEIYDGDLEEAIERINYLKLNETAVIFSKEKNSIIKWIVKIKANKIYVNKNPLVKYKFEISQKSFVRNKNII